MSEVPSDNQIRSVLDGVSAESIYPQCHVTHHSDGRVSYHHRLITPAIVAAGRARWKVENEDINTLKTKGYNLEHTILDLTDRRYQLLRASRGRRTRFFQELGVVACYWYHRSWADQMRFMVTQLELPDPGG